MKNKKTALLLLLLLAIPFFSIAQKPFQGEIIYKINIDMVGLDASSKEQMSKLQQVVFIKGSKSRIDIDFGMAKSISIADAKVDEMVVLTEIMGQKMKIIMDKEMLKAQDNMSSSYTTKLLKETKMIAGYLCQKVEITAPHLPEPAYVYYTSEIKGPKYSSQHHFLDGFPLEYSTFANGSLITYTAISVSRQKVKKKTFKIPSGYTETSLNTLQKMATGIESDF
ncbi:MAG: hypothetical protein H0X62_00300 [Bacteroidetes bacterium]|nr:hypothetical protein [Bacteroidota bacterium]